MVAMMTKILEGVERSRERARAYVYACVCSCAPCTHAYAHLGQISWARASASISLALPLSLVRVAVSSSSFLNFLFTNDSTLEGETLEERYSAARTVPTETDFDETLHLYGGCDNCRTETFSNKESLLLMQYVVQFQRTS